MCMGIGLTSETHSFVSVSIWLETHEHVALMLWRWPSNLAADCLICLVHASCGSLILRATPLVLSMWPCKLTLDEEKSTHVGLARQNGFGPAFLHSLLRLAKGTAKPNTCQTRVINKIWLLLPVSDWPIILIGQSGLLLVVSHLFAVPVLVLWVRLKNKWITKLGCEKYFCRVTCWAPQHVTPLEML